MEKVKKIKIKGKNQQEQSKASVLLVQPGPCSKKKLWFKTDGVPGLLMAQKKK